MLYFSGSGISVPQLRSYTKIREDMLSKVKEGKYLLGELVVPKSFVKTFLTNQGEILKKEFTIHARRIPLLDLRRKIFEDHKRLGIFSFIL